MVGNSVNRRGFIGSIAVCIAAVASRLHSRPVTCVACGSGSHVTSLCPINNAAMGEGESIHIYGSDGKRKGAANVMELNSRSQTMVLSGVVDVTAGDYIVYASNGSPIRAEF